jgi:hypothetical protein
VQTLPTQKNRGGGQSKQLRLTFPGAFNIQTFSANLQPTKKKIQTKKTVRVRVDNLSKYNYVYIMINKIKRKLSFL